MLDSGAAASEQDEVGLRKPLGTPLQVDRVVPRLQRWLERWPTPFALAADSPAEAIRMWEKAVLVAPSFIDVHLNLGKIFYTRGDLKKSVAHFETVLKLDPKNAEAAVFLRKMVE